MAFITIEGENKIALQQGNSQLLNITHFVLANIDGLGAEPADRIETLPDPADIVDTRPFTKAGYVNTNQVVYSLTLDSTVGDYTFNWVGLKDEDDVLIAVVYLADPITKTATDGGIEGNNLVRNFLVAFSGAQATTAINAPAETWQIDFTARLLQIDERERLSNFDIYGHDAFFAGGFNVTLNAGTVFDVSAGVGYVGGIRCELTSTQQIDVGALPNAIWVDASLQGDITGREADVQLVASSSPLTDYQDSNGINHYVAKLCDLSGGGIVTDAKNTTDLVEDHEGKPDPHPQYLTEDEADQLYEWLGSVEDHEAEANPHEQYLLDSQMVGLIFFSPTNAPPSGMIKANGAEVSRSAYSRLWAYAQSSGNLAATELGKYPGQFGPGDGLSTFSIPDVRSDFLRALDDGRGIDSGRELGSFQADELKEHIHDISEGNTTGDGSNKRLEGTDGAEAYLRQTYPTGGAETRPRNTAYLACIKY